MILLLLLSCAADMTCPEPDAPAAEAPDTDTGEACPPPDEPCTPAAFYLDCDGDGVGRSPDAAAYAASIACAVDDLGAPDDGCAWVSVAGDCDDTDLSIRPYGLELCDGRDNDCNSYVDEGCP